MVFKVYIINCDFYFFLYRIAGEIIKGLFSIKCCLIDKSGCADSETNVFYVLKLVFNHGYKREHIRTFPN